MSFVYAEHISDSINIHSDTKVGFNDFIGASISKEQQDVMRQYGIIKTKVISPGLAISFAGNNIFLASKLFKQISELPSLSTDEVLELAKKIHDSAAEDDIEFIITSCEKGKPSLNCIKNREVYCNCMTAWIGSLIAFNAFQQYKIGNKSNVSSSFLDVVNGCGDETVGGIHISAGYNPMRGYIGYYESKTIQISKAQRVNPGEVIKFDITNATGGFSYEQLSIDNGDLLIVIDQQPNSVLYSSTKRFTEDDARNPQLFGLLLPSFVEKDRHFDWISIE